MSIRVIAALGGLMLASAASATSFSGNFAYDNSKAGFHFNVDAPATVTITSTGFAAGGFDPILTVYDSTGLLVMDNDDDAGPDSKLTLDLAKGRYTVFLTQYNNFGAILLSNGFAFDGGDKWFRGGFIDAYGDQRTSFWAFDIDGGSHIGAVPEASTWAMLIAGFGLVGAIARRRSGTVVAA
jgi:hypothetical protein